MRRIPLVTLGLALLALPLSAQTADEIINNYIKTVGGMEKISAAKSLRRVGKFTGGGGFEAKLVQENERPNRVREEFALQGMTGVTAWDGSHGWKIEPWNGKKDPEALGEDEQKGIVEDADFDGPLVNYKAKGVKVEYVGMEPVEGTDAYKLKLTMPDGEIRHYYMDTDYYVPIKIETKRVVRGTEREFETSLGDYKEVNGWYLPFAYEVGAKGNPNRQKITYTSIEANVPLADARFIEPKQTGAGAKAEPPDASNTAPKKSEPAKPAAKPPAAQGGKKPAEGSAR
jgi:hypothetical protein